MADPLALLLFTLASIGGKFFGGRKLEKHQKELERITERQQKRAAIARALGTTDPFYKRIPETPSTTWEDLIGGLGEVGATFGAQYAAGRPQVPSELAPGRAGILRGGLRPRLQYGRQLPDLPYA